MAHVSKANNLQLLGPMHLSRNHCIRNMWQMTKLSPNFLLPVSYFLQLTPPPKCSPTPQIEPSTKNWVAKTWSAGAFHIQTKIPPLKLEMWSWGCHLLNNCWLLDFQWVLYTCFSSEGTHALILVFNCTVANVKTNGSVIPVPESCTHLWIRASNQVQLN